MGKTMNQCKFKTYRLNAKKRCDKGNVIILFVEIINFYKKKGRIDTFGFKGQFRSLAKSSFTQAQHD